jgi:murein DD-endopeptidase MepM/ murein hydrolase activator NlpD
MGRKFQIRTAYLSLAATALLALVSACKPEKPVITEVTEIIQDRPVPEERYGILLDDLEVRDHTVAGGQTLSGILAGEGLNAAEVHRILDAASDVLDLTKIRAGNSYSIFCKRDDSGKPVCMVYEEDKLGYVVLDWREKNASAYRVQKEVELRTQTAAGIIQNSLYQTVIDLGYDPALCMELAGIYRWSIDFFALQPGDKFRVIYRAQFAEDTYIGLKDILAASFVHSGKPFYAIRFENNEKSGYYDLDGMSLKSRFLQAPLEFTRISSRYTQNRFHPILKRNKPHLGTDYAAPTGTPVVSVADGVVLEAGFGRGNGNYVKVKHDNVYTTQYLHLSRFGSGIKRGVRVNQGQVIGYVGQTGLATGPHLCYRFWKNGKQVDPYKEQPHATEPLAEKDKPAFFQLRDIHLPALERIGYQEALLQASAQMLIELKGIERNAYQ